MSLVEADFHFEIIHPYQLLEFENKWYLLGYSETKKKLRVYGFDRIMPDFDLMKNIKFNDTKRNEVVKYSKYMFGVYPLTMAQKAS